MDWVDVKKTMPCGISPVVVCARVDGRWFVTTAWRSVFGFWRSDEIGENVYGVKFWAPLPIATSGMLAAEA